jgi:hypothetical protein
MFKKIYFPLISFALILSGIYISFDQQLPHYAPDISASNVNFSTDRALIHLKEITQKPHYVGTEEHTHVRNYLVKSLQKMGLTVEIQEKEVYHSKWKVASKVFNVLTKIEGTKPDSKSLLLLAHYDSAPHSKSLGASDDGSAVVTILETIRAYIASGKKPENDVIIMFSDAEELGLLGAKAFVENHPWAKKVGLVLNFEARGSGGPSYMLMETNGGNANFIQTFNEANVSNPVGNSLMYSVYKMLPNDTDLTVFRELAEIDGYNFAFIDDHFDYHSEQDSYQRLDLNSLKQQGGYAMALLNYYSDTDLSQLKSKSDAVFFNFPFVGLIQYPFTWVLPMVVLLTILFFWLFIKGIQKRRVNIKDSLRGFLPLGLALVSAFTIGWLGWKVTLLFFPDYKEILHGFTYNGHWFIMAFVALSIAVFLLIYKPYFERKTLPNLLFAPISLWLILNFIIAFILKGAGFFIIPTMGMLIAYAILILSHKINEKYIFIFTILSLPGLMIFSPLIAMFPVGLGLKMLVISTVLVVLILSTFISTFDYYRNHKHLIQLFLGISILTYTSAYFNSHYHNDQRKPNSIIFFQDVEQQEAYWASYDHTTDKFTEQFLGNKPQKGDLSIPFGSKYGTKLHLYQKTDMRNITLPNVIKSVNDTLFPDKTVLDYTIHSHRGSNMFFILAKDSMAYYEMNFNGVTSKTKSETIEKLNHTTLIDRKLATYYLTNGINVLHFTIVVPKGQKTDLELYDISLDLTDNKTFTLIPRSPIMMTKPFVINDAVVLKMRM